MQDKRRGTNYIQPHVSVWHFIHLSRVADYNEVLHTFIAFLANNRSLFLRIPSVRSTLGWFCHMNHHPIV